MYAILYFDFLTSIKRDCTEGGEELGWVFLTTPTEGHI